MENNKLGIFIHVLFLFLFFSCKKDKDIESTIDPDLLFCDSIINGLSVVKDFVIFSENIDGFFYHNDVPFDEEYFNSTLDHKYYYENESEQARIKDSIVNEYLINIPNSCRKNESSKDFISLLFNIVHLPLQCEEYYIYEEDINLKSNSIFNKFFQTCSNFEDKDIGKISVSSNGINFIIKNGFEIYTHVILKVNKESQKDAIISIEKFMFNGIDYTPLAHENDNWHKMNKTTNFLSSIKSTLIQNFSINVLYKDEIVDMLSHKFDEIELRDGYIFLKICKRSSLPKAEDIVRLNQSVDFYHTPSLQSKIVYSTQISEIYYLLDERDNMVFLSDGDGLIGWVEKQKITFVN